MFLFVVSRYCNARSFSTCVTSCADAAAAPVIKNNAASAPARDFFLMISFSFCVASVGETGSKIITHLFGCHVRPLRGTTSCAVLLGHVFLGNFVAPAYV